MSEDKKMQRCVVMTDKAKLEYCEAKEVLKPKSGQVLIKVECSPINPSDLYYMQGQYNGKYTYPLVPGSEGSGTVVESGGGMLAWSIMGKRVGFTRMMERGGVFSKDGAYGEYIVTNAF
jgi:NADPH:quinone reductase-like Zn-dependent oxidoreductase